MTTKEKLLQAVTDLLREDGIAAVSARAIADRAGVNQALVFYHFGTVTDLVDQACRARTDAAASAYDAELAEVTTLTDLLELGRGLHERERKAGNVAIMAQLLAGGQRDEKLAETSRYAMSRWTEAIEPVVERAIGGSVVADLIDPGGLARAVSAGFVGLILYDGVDEVGAGSAFVALEQLGALIEAANRLGPVAGPLLRSRVKRR